MDIKDQIDAARESLHDYCFNREKLCHDILPDLFDSVDLLLAVYTAAEAFYRGSKESTGKAFEDRCKELREALDAIKSND